MSDWERLLIEAAQLIREAKKAKEHGVDCADVEAEAWEILNSAVVRGE